MFNAIDVDEVATFLSIENVRLKIHYSSEKTVNHLLIAAVLSHSSILKKVKMSIDRLFSFFEKRHTLNFNYPLNSLQLKASYFKIFSGEPCGEPVKDEDAMAAYLIFKTIKDCSLMINIAYKDNVPRNSPLKWSQFDEFIFYSIQVIDLDEKFYSNDALNLSMNDDFVNSNAEKCCSIKCWFNGHQRKK